MSKYNIPYSFSVQLRTQLSVDFSRYSKMRPRKLLVDGVELRFYIDIPPKSSGFVMQAHFLTPTFYEKTEAAQNGDFHQQVLVFDQGRRITFQFKSWNDAAKFLYRLPNQMPANKVTILSLNLKGNYGFCADSVRALSYFMDHLSAGKYNYLSSHQMIKAMKHLRDEMVTVGFNL